MGHLRKRDLEGFLSGRQAPVRRVVRHLISGCSDCRSRVFDSAVAEEDEVYDACIDRALEAVHGRDDLWREERERRDRGLALVRAKGWANLTRHERLSLPRGRAGVEILLEASFQARYRDPKEMLRLAQKAKAAAEQLDPTLFGERAIFDLKARVWAELGNAFRVNERFDPALEAIQRARTLLEQGTGDLMTLARIDDIEGSWWKDQRHLVDAEDLLARACRRYLRIGERHWAGRTFVTRGISQFVAGRPLEAVAFLQQALQLLDTERDPQLIETTQHNLVFALADAGEFREAGELLLQSGLRQKFADDPQNLLRLRWVEAKILAGHGRLADAEKALRDVRASFRIQRLEFVATIVGLDLAKVLFQQGKLDQLRRFVRELRVAVEAYRLPDAVSHALTGLEVVCDFQIVTMSMLEAVRIFLHRFQYEPGLQWRPELLVVGYAR